MNVFVPLQLYKVSLSCHVRKLRHSTDLGHITRKRTKLEFQPRQASSSDWGQNEKVGETQE